MCQGRLAACLATSIAIVSVTLHGCSEEVARKIADDLNLTNESVENMTLPPELATTDAPETTTQAPAPGSTDAPAPVTTHASAPLTSEAATTTEMIRAFETMKEGTCCCATANKIGTKGECVSAVEELKSLDKDIDDKKLGWEGEDAQIPGGCSLKVWSDGTKHGHWNKVKSGKKRDNMIAICRKADDDRLRLFDDSIQADGPSSSAGVRFVACLSAGTLMVGVVFVVMRRGATWPVNRPEVDGLILGDDSEPEEA